MVSQIEHADMCLAVEGQDCSLMKGEFAQPPGWAVDEAIEELSEEAPWCRVVELAFEMVELAVGDHEERT